MAGEVERALLVAVKALRAISDDGQTSLRWRSRTCGHGAPEKPNVRVVAEDALEEISDHVLGPLSGPPCPSHAVTSGPLERVADRSAEPQPTDLENS